MTKREVKPQTGGDALNTETPKPSSPGRLDVPPTPTFREAVAQEVEWARKHFPNQESSLALSEWLSILLEEVGEVANSLNEGHEDDTIKAELVQVAAMAERMASSLRYQGGRGRGWSSLKK
jgi:NTP pyrophosphatase (non-canonical NTP hydrolase)